MTVKDILDYTLVYNHDWSCPVFTRFGCTVLGYYFCLDRNYKLNLKLKFGEYVLAVQNEQTEFLIEKYFLENL